MRITHLVMGNHSRVPDLGLEVRRHAVIIGANDVGKSSILRMLHMLLGASTAALYQNLVIEDVRDPMRPLSVDVTLGAFTDFERGLFPNEIDVAPTDKSESLLVRLQAERDPEDTEAVTIRRWFPNADHERGPTREQQQAFGWRYLPATRGLSPTALDGPNSAVRTLLGNTDLGAGAAQLGGMLEQFNDELAKSSNIVDLIKRVAEHLSLAMPRRLETGDLAIRTTANPAADVLEGVSIFLQRDGGHVPLHDQSDGIRQLTAMTLFDLAEGAANVVAIDEPELHLHPASQRTIAELFDVSPNQKLLATHSPFIVHRFQPADVVAVSPDGTCHQIPDAQLSAVEKQLVNWWSPRLLEALTASFVVIVEGASDRVIVEAVSRQLSVDLDRIGAIVFDLDGADKFKHVYKLLGPQGFGVHVLGLVDEKEQGSWLGAVGGKPTSVMGSAIWVSKADLEDEYSAALGGPSTARALVEAGESREASILSSASASSLEDVTAEAIARYCRDRKIAAATAVAAALTPETPPKCKSVAGLVAKLGALSSS